MDANRPELEVKEERLREMMERLGLDAVLLRDPANVAWLSGGGRTYINIASESGVGSLLVTKGERYLLTDVIEAQRLSDEEGFGSGGWQVIAEPWHEKPRKLGELTAGLRVGADGSGEGLLDVKDEVARLRWLLTPEEMARYRALGTEAGAAIGEAAREVRPGMTEFDIAGLLAGGAHRRGAVPVVVLVATDERMRRRRHPLPTERKMERAAMLVLCARKHGLVASVTRLVHVGPPPEEMRRGMRAVAAIEAAAVLATKPRARANDIFAVIQRAYAETGFPDEWKHHHQGGAAGYAARDYIATPDTDYLVEDAQAFAWNPSVPGAKSEDTFLITGEGYELLTPSPGWPQQQVQVGGVTMERPDVLEIG
ncbi:MAG: M24 family metallopeptidase [Chloroflexia bacterium]